MFKSTTLLDFQFEKADMALEEIQTSSKHVEDIRQIIWKKSLCSSHFNWTDRIYCILNQIIVKGCCFFCILPVLLSFLNKIN